MAFDPTDGSLGRQSSWKSHLRLRWAATRVKEDDERLDQWLTDFVQGRLQANGIRKLFQEAYGAEDFGVPTTDGDLQPIVRSCRVFALWRVLLKAAELCSEYSITEPEARKSLVNWLAEGLEMPLINRAEQPSDWLVKLVHSLPDSKSSAGLAYAFNEWLNGETDYVEFRQERTKARMRETATEYFLERHPDYNDLQKIADYSLGDTGKRYPSVRMQAECDRLTYQMREDAASNFASYCNKYGIEGDTRVQQYDEFLDLLAAPAKKIEPPQP